MGTVGYMSPEQLCGETVGAPSDIFALGAVLYEMLAGRRAFDGRTAQDMLSAILRDDPPDLASVGTSIPADLIRIVSHCLEKNAGERFQSARDLAFALKTVASGGSASRPSSETIDSIAVLPFENASRDPDVEYLSDGITETIINRLTQLAGLRVTPRSTVFHYKGREIDPQVAGREIGAQVVLTGRILQRGDRLVVGAELIDVAQQAQLWGERFTRKLADIFAIEEELASRISESLRGRLTRDDRQRLTRRSTEDSEAYRLYLRGRHAFNRRTPASLQHSLRHFAQAIERDPEYALAYSGLCDSYSVLSYIGVMDPGHVWPKCREAATRAVAIDDSLAEAHTSLGSVRAFADWNWREAEDEFRRAVELNPRYVQARTWYAFQVLAPLGRFDEAAAQIRFALDVEPLSPTVNLHAAMVALQQHHTEKAIEYASSALELDPGFVFAHVWLAMAYELQHQHDAAIAEFEKAVVPLREAAVGWQGLLAHALACAGRRGEADTIVADLVRCADERYVDAVLRAAAHVGLDQPKEAIDCLERAADDRSALLVVGYPVLDPLRSDARFARLMARLGLPANPRAN